MEIKSSDGNTHYFLLEIQLDFTLDLDEDPHLLCSVQFLHSCSQQSLLCCFLGMLLSIWKPIKDKIENGMDFLPNAINPLK